MAHSASPSFCTHCRQLAELGCRKTLPGSVVCSIHENCLKAYMFKSILSFYFKIFEILPGLNSFSKDTKISLSRPHRFSYHYSHDLVLDQCMWLWKLLRKIACLDKKGGIWGMWWKLFLSRVLGRYQINFNIWCAVPKTRLVVIPTDDSASPSFFPHCRQLADLGYRKTHPGYVVCSIHENCLKAYMFR